MHGDFPSAHLARQLSSPHGAALHPPHRGAIISIGRPDEPFAVEGVLSVEDKLEFLFSDESLHKLNILSAAEEFLDSIWQILVRDEILHAIRMRVF